MKSAPICFVCAACRTAPYVHNNGNTVPGAYCRNRKFEIRSQASMAQDRGGLPTTPRACEGFRVDMRCDDQQAAAQKVASDVLRRSRINSETRSLLQAIEALRKATRDMSIRKVGNVKVFAAALASVGDEAIRAFPSLFPAEAGQ